MSCRPIEVARRGCLLTLALLLGCGGEPASAPVDVQPAAAPEPPRITQFYASPGVVSLGEETTICYGVEHTDSVALEPDVRAIKPGRNRCFAHAPARTAVYKLTATGPGGEATAELALKVTSAAPPAPAAEAALITVFVASEDSVPMGSPVTLCYTLEGAEDVKIEPAVQEVEPAGSCFTTRMQESTTFQLTATGGGRSESRSVTVKVQ